MPPAKYPALLAQVDALQAALKAINPDLTQETPENIGNIQEAYGLTLALLEPGDPLPEPLEPNTLYVSRPDDNPTQLTFTIAEDGAAPYTFTVDAREVTAAHFDNAAKPEAERKKIRPVPAANINETFIRDNLHRILLAGEKKTGHQVAGLTPAPTYPATMLQCLWNVSEALKYFANHGMNLGANPLYYRPKIATILDKIGKLKANLKYLDAQTWTPFIVDKRSYEAAQAFYALLQANKEDNSDGRQLLSIHPLIANSLIALGMATQEKIDQNQIILFDNIPALLKQRMEAYYRENQDNEGLTPPPHLAEPEPPAEVDPDADESEDMVIAPSDADQLFKKLKGLNKLLQVQTLADNPEPMRAFLPEDLWKEFYADYTALSPQPDEDKSSPGLFDTLASGAQDFVETTQWALVHRKTLVSVLLNPQTTEGDPSALLGDEDQDRHSEQSDDEEPPLTKETLCWIYIHQEMLTTACKLIDTIQMTQAENEKLWKDTYEPLDAKLSNLFRNTVVRTLILTAGILLVGFFALPAIGAAPFLPIILPVACVIGALAMIGMYFWSRSSIKQQAMDSLYEESDFPSFKEQAKSAIQGAPEDAQSFIEEKSGQTEEKTAKARVLEVMAYFTLRPEIAPTPAADLDVEEDDEADVFPPPRSGGS